MQSLTTKRLSIVVLVIMIISIAMMESSGNPSPDHNGDASNVVEALRYLQDIESRHAQFARPRYTFQFSFIINKRKYVCCFIYIYWCRWCRLYLPFYVMNFLSSCYIFTAVIFFYLLFFICTFPSHCHFLHTFYAKRWSMMKEILSCYEW